MGSECNFIVVGVQRKVFEEHLKFVYCRSWEKKYDPPTKRMRQRHYTYASARSRVSDGPPVGRECGR